jgi:hypothetical protein
MLKLLLVSIIATRLLTGLTPMYLPDFFKMNSLLSKEKTYINEQDTSLA